MRDADGNAPVRAPGPLPVPDPNAWDEPTSHLPGPPAQPVALRQALTLLAQMTNSEECWYGHSDPGRCQAHNLIVEPGHFCPHVHAQRLLTACGVAWE